MGKVVDFLKDKKQKEAKVALCIPCTHTHVPKEFFVALMSIIKPANVGMVMNMTGYVPLDFNRNQLVKKSLQDKNVTHIWFLDNDIVPPSNVLPLLLGVNDDITGLLCFKKTHPYYPVAYKNHPTDKKLRRVYAEFNPGELLKPDAIGTGCMMIKREVFEAIPYPWFKFEDDNGRLTGEDINFCNAAKSAGFSISCITSSTCSHIDSHRFGLPHWMTCRDKEIEMMEKSGVFKMEDNDEA